MLSAVFPDEILEEVMTYWGGHRLGLTCRRLLARMSADNYATPTNVRLANERRAITCRLPNGIFHGVSIFSSRCRQVLTYDRGAILSISELAAGRKVVRHDAIIRGYHCEMFDTSVWIGGKHVGRADSVDDFNITVRTILGGMVEGSATSIPVKDKWLVRAFPRLRYVR